MGPQARQEYLAQLRDRYVRAARKEKGRMLTEAVTVTGYHRKAIIRAWQRPDARRARGPRRGRPTRYGPVVVRALRAVWEAAGYPWSLRLKALLPLWLPWARRRLALSPATETKLRAISARQMDRVLAPDKRTIRRRLYGRTKPGTLLKHHIPIKPDHWDVTEPGFTEVDLVSHSGDRADGDFVQTLNLTDIHTTWVETCAVMGKSQIRVQEGLERLRQQLPFALRGIDSDNGSEFINAHLLKYCLAHDVQFTRGRPYKKDDNAHIEQKNWTHVRKLMGYVRYDSAAALAAMNAVYADLRLLHNLFLPSVKLQRKERHGARAPARSARSVCARRAGRSAARPALHPGQSPAGRAADHRGGRGATGPERLCRRVSSNAQNASPFGNTCYGATKRRSVTLTYGSTRVLNSDHSAIPTGISEVTKSY